LDKLNFSRLNLEGESGRKRRSPQKIFKTSTKKGGMERGGEGVADGNEEEGQALPKKKKPKAEKNLEGESKKQ